MLELLKMLLEGVAWAMAIASALGMTAVPLLMFIDNRRKPKQRPATTRGHRKARGV